MEYINKKIKIMVVDDHDLFREGLILILKTEEDFDVIGEASNGKEALQFLEDYRPDIILLDMEMPVMKGSETLIIIHKLYPEIKVIILTMYVEKIYETHFMDLGAHSFLTKNVNSSEIFRAIRSINKGRYYYSTINQSAQTHIAAIHAKHLQLSLNDRERDILKLMCENKTNGFISKSLTINVHTIRYLRKNIYSKTKTSSLSELVKYAIKNGIIPLE